MTPDGWLIEKFLKLLRWRYGRQLYSEFASWHRVFEEERLKSLLDSLGSCGTDVTLRPGMNILSPENVYLGNHVGIGYNSILRGHGGITIGDFTMIGDSVIIATAGHPVGEIYYNNTWQKPVVLEENVWLGANVLVMPGVTIGENAVIGAGAVVTEDIPANHVAAGVPAKVIRQFTPTDLDARKAEIRRKFAHRRGAHY
jgi:galactoside O-acetyltransferase